MSPEVGIQMDKSFKIFLKMIKYEIYEQNSGKKGNGEILNVGSGDQAIWIKIESNIVCHSASPHLYIK